MTLKRTDKTAPKYAPTKVVNIKKLMDSLHESLAKEAFAKMSSVEARNTFMARVLVTTVKRLDEDIGLALKRQEATMKKLINGLSKKA